MIEFNENNRPICGPTTEAQCTLNWAALQDVWDALSCFSSAMVYDGCAILEGEIAKDDPTDPSDGFEITLDKATYGENTDECYYDVFINGLSALAIGSPADAGEELPHFRVDDLDDDNLQVVINPGSVVMGDASANIVYQIKVRKYTTFLERINECEAEINCRDIE